MIDPAENEEINEELSSGELKSVSGGISQAKLPIGSGIIIRDNDTMLKGNGPQGSGSGETLDDYNKRVGLDTGPINKSEVGPIGRER